MNKHARQVHTPQGERPIDNYSQWYLEGERPIDNYSQWYLALLKHYELSRCLSIVESSTVKNFCESNETAKI